MKGVNMKPPKAVEGSEHETTKSCRRKPPKAVQGIVRVDVKGT